MSIIPENCNACGFFGENKCLHDHGSDTDVGDGSHLPQHCPIKEDVLDAKRFKVKYRGEGFYLIVATLEGQPWEVFVEHAINRKYTLQYMMSAWDTATRFISRDLKREPLASTVQQLERSSRQKEDLPDIIGGKLKEWL